MHQALGGVMAAQAVEQVGGEEALVRPQGGGVPLRVVGVVDGDEGGFAAHGQAHVATSQVGVDARTQFADGLPLLLAVGLGHSWRFPDPLDAHLVGELALAFFHRTADGCRG
ncbi:hypothetical protein D9M69_468860 [compost metagenome]